MRSPFLLLWLVLAALSVHGQVPLTLEQAQIRSGPDRAPARKGIEARLSGTVSSAPVWDLQSYYLPIQDETAHGIWLEGSARQFAGFVPGDRVEATGVIVQHAGMAVLSPARIVRLSHGAPPEPQPLRVAEAIGMRYLGVLVSVEGRISGRQRGQTGSRLKVAGGTAKISVFLPQTSSDASPDPLDHFHQADRVRVTGIASQFCPLPPFDKSFQILIGSPSAVQMLQPGELIPSLLVLTGVVAIALILSVWWMREHRAGVQRRAIRTLNAVGEEILASHSPEEIVTRLIETVPLAGGSGARLFLYNGRTKCLDRVSGGDQAGPVSISIDATSGALPAGAALAFRNRALLSVSDIVRSPFFKPGQADETPRSAMFVPVLVPNDILGVLEVYHTAGVRHFSPADQGVARQLANFAAAALKLQEEQAVREKLDRTERMAATGQLISGIAHDLRPSMEHILSISKKLALGTHAPAVQRDLRTLAVEAERAAEVLARVIAYSRAGSPEPKAVELNAIVASLIRSREKEWKTLGIEGHNRLSREPLYTTGSVAQLEQVLFGMLMQAEQCAAAAAERFLDVSSRSSGRQAMIRFEFGCSPDALLPAPAAEIRVLRPSQWVAQLEIEFPLWDEVPPAAEPSEQYQRPRSLTVLVVEPDPGHQRRMVTDLSQRGYRVVPVSTAEEGLDLVQRVRFEIVFCAARLPGLNWMELTDRARNEMGAFVLMEEVFSDRTLAFGAGDFILYKPAYESDLDRVIGLAEMFLDRETLAER